MFVYVFIFINALVYERCTELMYFGQHATSSNFIFHGTSIPKIVRKVQYELFNYRSHVKVWLTQQ